MERGEKRTRAANIIWKLIHTFINVGENNGILGLFVAEMFILCVHVLLFKFICIFRNMQRKYISIYTMSRVLYLNGMLLYKMKLYIYARIYTNSSTHIRNSLLLLFYDNLY